MPPPPRCFLTNMPSYRGSLCDVPNSKIFLGVIITFDLAFALCIILEGEGVMATSMDETISLLERNESPLTRQNSNKSFGPHKTVASKVFIFTAVVVLGALGLIGHTHKQAKENGHDANSMINPLLKTIKKSTSSSAMDGLSLKVHNDDYGELSSSTKEFYNFFDHLVEPLKLNRFAITNPRDGAKVGLDSEFKNAHVLKIFIRIF
jgi:hypothetical protein